MLGILFITLVVLSYGNCVPRKDLPTKAELHYKTDTKTLEDMLAELMDLRGDELASANQVVNCISRTTQSGESVTLTLTQLNEILSSLTGGTNIVYILTSDRKIYSGTNEAYLYDLIRNDYAQHSYRATPNELWLNKAPCAICADYLEVAFDNRPGNKPTIYVETLQYDETDYGNLLKSIGCLAQLQAKEFPIKAWNWNTFKAGLQETSSCTNAIDTQIAASSYATPKADLEQFVNIFNALTTSHNLDTWCQ